MRIVNEKVATCYYKSERTIVRNNHVTKVTKEVELISVNARQKVLIIHIRVRLRKSYLRIFKVSCYVIIFPT